VQLEDAIDDEFRLLLLIAGGNEPGRFPANARRPQILREPLLGSTD